MRIGRSFRDGVLRFAEPRLNRVNALSIESVGVASAAPGTYYDAELILKQTLGLHDESGVNEQLYGVATCGDWDATDPTS
jgi:hypothetical protein